MTDEPDLHDLLTRVASGELDPAEAARLLDDDPRAPTVDHGPLGSYDGIAGISVGATGVRLTVVADPTVATAVADGPHKVHQDGDRLVFELPGRERGNDGFETTPRWQWGRMRLDWPYGSGERVALRVNPALPLDLVLTACDASVRGLRAALTVAEFSSSLTVTDHDGPLRGTVSTSSAKVEAVLRGDDDALSCDMGSLKLTLLPGSDTTMTASAEMGSVKVAGAGARAGSDDVPGLRTTTTATAGAGHGRLAVTVRMGSAKVTLP
jgi:hypothetical protein